MTPLRVVISLFRLLVEPAPAFAGAGLFLKPVPTPDQVRGRLFRDQVLPRERPANRIMNLSHRDILGSAVVDAPAGCATTCRANAAGRRLDDGGDRVERRPQKRVARTIDRDGRRSDG